MEVKRGYKQTDVGRIPEDWEAGGLGRFWGVTDCKHLTADFIDNGIPLASIKEVQGRYVDLTNAKQTTEAYYSQLVEGGRKPQPGDLILSRNATVGEVAQVTELHPRFAMGQDVCLLRKKSSVHSTEYLQAVFQSPIIATQLTNLMVGSTFKRVNVEQLRNLIVPMPHPDEQRAIATALGDVDSLIAALDQLIAKKRDLKHAAMQQLLTGQHRLQGFHGEWAPASLDEVTQRATGYWGAEVADEFRSKRVRVIRAGDISVEGVLKSTVVRYLTERECIRALCNLDDVVITASGSVGKVWWCDGREDIAASNFVRILRPRRSRASGLFLSCLLRSEVAQQVMIEHVATGVLANLGSTFYSSRWISLPPRAEQIDIAKVLSDMDVELTALEQRRKKTRDLKKAMMQELLTGRTRLS